MNELDKSGILAEGLDLGHVNVLAVRMRLHCLKHLGNIFPSFGFVNVLELDINCGYSFHVGNGTREREFLMFSVELLDSISNDPETRT